MFRSRGTVRLPAQAFGTPKPGPVVTRWQIAYWLGWAFINGVLAGIALVLILDTVGWWHPR